jgi:hypothetical protein
MRRVHASLVKERKDTRRVKDKVILFHLRISSSFTSSFVHTFCAVVFHASEGGGKERYRGGKGQGLSLFILVSLYIFLSHLFLLSLFQFFICVILDRPSTNVTFISSYKKKQQNVPLKRNK